MTTTIAAGAGGGFSGPNHSDEFEMRPFSPNAERSIYISHSVADTIDACPLIKMLCEHSMEAGHTLNVLHELDRIGEMKSQCGYQGEKSATSCGTVFISNTWRFLRIV